MVAMCQGTGKASIYTLIFGNNEDRRHPDAALGSFSPLPNLCPANHSDKPYCASFDEWFDANFIQCFFHFGLIQISAETAVIPFTCADPNSCLDGASLSPSIGYVL